MGGCPDRTSKSDVLCSWSFVCFPDRSHNAFHDCNPAIACWSVVLSPGTATNDSERSPRFSSGATFCSAIKCAAVLVSSHDGDLLSALAASSIFDPSHHQCKCHSGRMHHFEYCCWVQDSSRDED